MNRQLLILIIIFLFPEVSFGQAKSDLAGAIIKKTNSSPQAPLSIKDFSYDASNDNVGFLNAQRTKPGVAFLSSALIPGSSQAANGKWVRAGIYVATEAFSIFYYINRTNAAKDQERRYEAFANSEWSVIAYSQWLIGYYDNNGLNHPRLGELRSMVQGQTPDFTNSTNDWSKVDLRLLQSIERNTPLICGSCGSGNFSHVLPAYGSQQYFELISKYFQFEGGWSDFYAENVAGNNPSYNYQYDNDGDFASMLFLLGAERADQFNNNYRRAGNILNLLVINHVVSAFDAFFSVKLKNARLEASADMLRADAFSLTLHF